MDESSYKRALDKLTFSLYPSNILYYDSSLYLNNGSLLLHILIYCLISLIYLSVFFFFLGWILSY